MSRLPFVPPQAFVVAINAFFRKLFDFFIVFCAITIMGARRGLTRGWPATIARIDTTDIHKRGADLFCATTKTPNENATNENGAPGEIC